MPHTPGPWHVSDEETRRRDGDISVNSADFTLLAEVNRIHAKMQEERVANARLIAAAPALLEVLEAIMEDVGYGGGGAKLCEQFQKRARAAIAAARGEGVTA